MNSGLSYQLPTFTGITRHGWSGISFLRDANNASTARLEIDAQVRSGDYFVTLATILDSLSSDIDNYTIRADLEDIVSDLIYLQDSYSITKTDRTNS